MLHQWNVNILCQRLIFYIQIKLSLLLVVAKRSITLLASGFISTDPLPYCFCTCIRAIPLNRSVTIMLLLYVFSLCIAKVSGYKVFFLSSLFLFLSSTFIYYYYYFTGRASKAKEEVNRH